MLASASPYDFKPFRMTDDLPEPAAPTTAIVTSVG